MKPAIILLMTADPVVESVACEAVTALRHGLRTARSAAQGFRALETGRDDVDAVIVDLDPGVHGIALLEAAEVQFPVIVLTSLEANYMSPVASRHGARECLTKPVRVEELQAALKRALAAAHPA